MVEENNSLDSFLADGDSAPAPEKSASDIQPQNPQGFTHPKLKKIKRPKIRPMSDVPPAPAKIEPTEQPVDETTHLTETTEDEASLGTSLVTATDAQDLVRESDFNNSYVLDGLPPELDYASEEDGGYEPAYTDNKATLKKLIAENHVRQLAISIFYSLYPCTSESVTLLKKKSLCSYRF